MFKGDFSDAQTPSVRVHSMFPPTGNGERVVAFIASNLSRAQAIDFKDALRSNNLTTVQDASDQPGDVRVHMKTLTDVGHLVTTLSQADRGGLRFTESIADIKRKVSIESEGLKPYAAPSLPGNRP